MKLIFKLFIILFTLFGSSQSLLAQGNNYVSIVAKPGDGIYQLMRKYNLSIDDCNLNQFCKLNKISQDAQLLSGKKYFLPISIHKFDGKNIRSSIGNKDITLAKEIESFNLLLSKKKLKKAHFKNDKQVWVPYDLVNCNNIEKENNKTTTKKETVNYSIFGKKYEQVTIKNDKLKGKIFYLESGHGGPDPGAVAKLNKHNLCEDEYAYDVTLRLGRKLIENGATVYFIVRDDEGIREEMELDCDEDEVVLGDLKIPLDQLERLQQRAEVINKLYRKHQKEGVKEQYQVTIHVDSRSKVEKVDVFFYFKQKSVAGEKLAKTIQKKFKEKYDYHQGEGRYKGNVYSRNLYMLRVCKPLTLYIELANIKNEADRKRIMVEKNRDLVAEWLLEGYLDYFGKN